MTSAQEPRSVFSLLLDISHNIQDLIRSEVKLAKVEGKEAVASFAAPAKLLSVGGVLLLYSGGLLLLALVQGLSLVMPLWASYLAVGALIGIIGAVTVGRGRSRLPDMNFESQKNKLSKVLGD